MKIQNELWILALIGVFLVITCSCSKDDSKDDTIVYGTVTDVEGNVYKTVTIGNQVWMAENLKTTKYRNGDLIETTPPGYSISGESTPKYQWAYNRDESNVATYGRLYTWYAATDSRNICPIGWHLPNNRDWITLRDFLGGDNNAGGQLKAKGTSFWNSPNTGATNGTGFTALPGGLCHYGAFDQIGKSGFWWSAASFESTTWEAYFIGMGSDTGLIYINIDNMKEGFSIRCVKD
jgi:uncharacterized protein (TIGR02145 family)